MVVLAEGTPGGVFNGSRYLEGSAVKCPFTAMIQRGKLGVSSVASLPIVSAASLPEMITLLIGVRLKFQRGILGIQNKLGIS